MLFHFVFLRVLNRPTSDSVAVCMCALIMFVGRNSPAQHTYIPSVLRYSVPVAFCRMFTFSIFSIVLRIALTELRRRQREKPVIDPY